MLWLIVALLTAFFAGTLDAISKKVVRVFDEYFVVWVRVSFSLPFLLVVLFYFGIPTIDPRFWLALFVLIPINIFANVLYIKAIKVSPLSLTIPFLALTPIFLIGVSYLMLNELPTAIGTIGIFLVVFGAYSMNLAKSKQGFFAPFKAILHEKGSWYMVIVAFIFAITATLGKVCIQYSSPAFLAFILYFFSSIILFLFLIKRKHNFKLVKQNKNILLLLGIFAALMVTFHNIGVMMTIVPYFISIKRTGMIFAIFYGYFIFKEKNIKERLFGASLMVLGVILISLF